MTGPTPSPPALAASIIEAPGARLRHNLYVLHGIYGRGRNWAAIARRLTPAREDWRTVLVDLRGHGDSPTPEGPHTIGQVAKDVAQTANAQQAPVNAILGHSFGGKVALAFAAVAPPDLEQVWLIDSTPAPKVPDGSAWKMLGLAQQHPGPFASRQAAAEMLQAEGIAPPVAAWMASNVAWDEGRYRWRLDFDVMEDMLHDFFRQDFWHVIESPPPKVTIHVVKAMESSLLNNEACTRVAKAARDNGRVFLHRLRGGHWLNTDNPEALTALLAAELPRHA